MPVRMVALVTWSLGHARVSRAGQVTSVRTVFVTRRSCTDLSVPSFARVIRTTPNSVTHGGERASARMASPAVIVTARVQFTLTEADVETCARVRTMPTVTQ